MVLTLGACLSEMPVPDSDPWKYDRPWAVGIDNGPLDRLNIAIKDGDFGALHSLLIIRDKKIVFENYYNGTDRQTVQPLDAATKSIVSVLFGILMMEDATISTNTLIKDVLPQYAHYFVDVPQKDQIRIADLLSNSSGLWWDEWDRPYTDPANDATFMSTKNDWSDWVLSRPMIREPGYSFNYNSGNAVIMGRIIENVTGMTLEDYAAKRLFEPLGIDSWSWDVTNSGSGDAAWGLHLKPLDLAKIGYLFIEDGKWNDRQLFEERWAGQSTRSRASVSGYYNYGYQWWKFSSSASIIRRLENIGLKSNDIFFAWGRGGQMLIVFPSYKMLIVMTGGNGPEYFISAIDILLDYIIPAMQFPSYPWLF